MQQAILDLQQTLRAQFRTFNRVGDPESGLHEPDLEQLYAAFGTVLPGILARALIGPAGADYPAFPAVSDLLENVFYLHEDAGQKSWALIDVAAVQRAAELVDFEGDIADALDAAIQPIIDEISDDAPFDERFDDDTALLADLNFPDGAYAIDMTNLVIYKKSGAEGEGSWAVHSNILAAFPGTASAADIADVNDRIDLTEADITALGKRMARLDALFPPVAPTWRIVPPVSVDETFTGAVLDLADYVDDEDTPAENLVFSFNGAVPSGFEIQGSELVRVASSGIVEKALYTIRVTDESDQYALQFVSIEVYEEGVPPSLPPVWSSPPSLVRVEGNTFTWDFSPYLTDPDTDAADLTVALETPISGIAVNSAAKTVTFTGLPVGQQAFTLIASDPQGNETPINLTITTSTAASPLILPPSNRQSVQGSAPVVVDLGPLASDANTPDSELGATLVVENAPAGTTKNGLVITHPTTSAGFWQVTVTVTNRAGKSASASYDLTIFSSSITGGVTGGGGGGTSGNVIIARF